MYIIKLKSGREIEVMNDWPSDLLLDILQDNESCIVVSYYSNSIKVATKERDQYNYPIINTWEVQFPVRMKNSLLKSRMYDYLVEDNTTP